MKVIKYSAPKIIPFGFSLYSTPLMLLLELQYIPLHKKFTLDFASYINPLRPGGGGVFHPPPRFFLNNFGATKVIFLKICDFSPILIENVSKSEV